MAAIHTQPGASLMTPLAYETALEHEAPPAPLSRPAAPSETSAEAPPAATPPAEAPKGDSILSLPKQLAGTFEHLDRFATGAWNSTVGFAIDATIKAPYDLARAGIWLAQNHDLKPEQQSRPPQMVSHLMQAIETPTLPSITGNGPAHPLEHMLAVLPLLNTPYIAQDVLKAIRNNDTGHMAELAGGILGGALFMEAAGVPGRINTAGTKVMSKIAAAAEGGRLATAAAGAEGRAVAPETATPRGAEPQRSYSKGAGNGDVPEAANKLHAERNGAAILDERLENSRDVPADFFRTIEEFGGDFVNGLSRASKQKINDALGTGTVEQAVRLAEAEAILAAEEAGPGEAHPLAGDDAAARGERARLMKPVLDHLYAQIANKLDVPSIEAANRLLADYFPTDTLSQQADIVRATNSGHVVELLQERLETTGHSIENPPFSDHGPVVFAPERVAAATQAFGGKVPEWAFKDALELEEAFRYEGEITGDNLVEHLEFKNPAFLQLLDSHRIEQILKAFDVETLEQATDLVDADPISTAADWEMSDMHNMEGNGPEKVAERKEMIQPVVDHLYRIAAREMKLESPEQARQVLGDRIRLDTILQEGELVRAALDNQIVPYLQERLATTGHSLENFPLECEPIPRTAEELAEIERLQNYNLDKAVDLLEGNGMTYHGSGFHQIARNYGHYLRKIGPDLADRLTPDLRQQLNEHLGTQTIEEAGAVSSAEKFDMHGFDGKPETEARYREGYQPALDHFYKLAAREMKLESAEQARQVLGHDANPPSVKDISQIVDSVLDGRWSRAIRHLADGGQPADLAKLRWKDR